MDYFEKMYSMSIVKYTHTLLSNDKDNKHYLFNDLIQNRTIRCRTENKCGTKIKISINDSLTTKSFIHRSKEEFNKLNRSLTLITNHNPFKKQLKKATLDPTAIMRIPKYSDHVVIDNYIYYDGNYCTP